MKPKEAESAAGGPLEESKKAGWDFTPSGLSCCGYFQSGQIKKALH
jgi:hypothetical protein